MGVGELNDCGRGGVCGCGATSVAGEARGRGKAVVGDGGERRGRGDAVRVVLRDAQPPGAAAKETGKD